MVCTNCYELLVTATRQNLFSPTLRFSYESQNHIGRMNDQRMIQESTNEWNGIALTLTFTLDRGKWTQSKNAEDDFCFELRQKCHRDWHIRLNWLSRRLLGDWGNNFNKLGHFRSLGPYWCKVQNGAAYWRRRNYPNSACSIINIRPTSK